MNIKSKIYKGCNDCNLGILPAENKIGRTLCKCSWGIVRQHLLDNYYRIPKRKQNFDPNKLNETRKEIARGVASGIKDTVYLTGGYGCGKTTLASAICRMHLHRMKGRIIFGMIGTHCPACNGERCRICDDTGVGMFKGPFIKSEELFFTTANDLIEDTKRAWDKGVDSDLLTRAKTAKILIMDEFQVMMAHKSEYWAEGFFTIMDKRHDNMATSVYISNLRLDDLAEIDGRVASRFEEGEYYDFGNTDYRKANGA